MDKNNAVVSIFLLGMLSFSPSLAAGDGLTPTYFSVGGSQAFILRPPQPAVGAPWVWCAPTFAGQTPYAHQDWYFQKLLDNGIAVAGIDVGESYGSPAGRAVYSQFYTYATAQAHLAAKACMLAQSRGGLMAYNWAEDPGNAGKLSAIAGVFPVCDIRSYPGLATAAPAYGMTEAQLASCLPENNPIDRLAPLALADIPILHLQGDSDTIVPLAANSQVVYDRYTAMGGQMQLIIVPGKGHEEAPEFWQSTQLLDFMVIHASVPEPSTVILLVTGLSALLVYAWRKRK